MITKSNLLVYWHIISLAYQQIIMFSLNNTELFLLGSSLVWFIVLSLYYLIIYARPLRAAKQTGRFTDDEQKPPVSIIIYARNDSDNLKRNLPSLLSQDYPDYQVVVIDDSSSDDTDDTLKFLQNTYKNLYHTYIPSGARYLSHRKLAFTLGVKAAKHDILLFTEANCQPLSDKWLSEMVKGYSSSTSIVLGFCRYGNYRGLLQKLIAYDNLLTGLRYLSSSLMGHPYTGNGRNLSYRKEVFFKHKGYYKSLNLHAGDDDLFINEAATKDNTSAVCTADSLTEMNRIERFGMWKELKVSRVATQRYYKGNVLALFHIESACFLMFQISAIGSMLIGIEGNWMVSVISLLLYLSRFTIKAVVFGKSAKMLKQNPSIGWLFLMEFIQPIFDLQTRIYRIFSSSKDYTFSIES